ncbi:MAG: KEOPS complex subunit Cgi121 [Candidatus Heimdallarchaeota archaeon]
MHQINDYSIIISKAMLNEQLTDKGINKLVIALRAEENKFSKDSSLFIIDADSTAGLNHFLACALYSLKAFDQKNNLSKTFAAEIMLYLSGYRQISKALLKVGLTPKSINLLLVQITKTLDVDGKQTIKHFSYEKFLANQKVGIVSYFADIEELSITNEKKVMTNLGIAENSIELLVTKNNDEYTREKAIEKLAIEKSAILNLLK